jgi:hypothetical protein
MGHVALRLASTEGMTAAQVHSTHGKLRYLCQRALHGRSTAAYKRRTRLIRILYGPHSQGRTAGTLPPAPAPHAWRGHGSRSWRAGPPAAPRTPKHKARPREHPARSSLPHTPPSAPNASLGVVQVCHQLCLEQQQRSGAAARLPRKVQRQGAVLQACRTMAAGGQGAAGTGGAGADAPHAWCCRCKACSKRQRQQQHSHQSEQLPAEAGPYSGTLQAAVNAAAAAAGMLSAWLPAMAAACPRPTLLGSVRAASGYASQAAAAALRSVPAAALTFLRSKEQPPTHPRYGASPSAMGARLRPSRKRRENNQRRRKRKAAQARAAAHALQEQQHQQQHQHGQLPGVVPRGVVAQCQAMCSNHAKACMAEPPLQDTGASLFSVCIAWAQGAFAPATEGLCAGAHIAASQRTSSSARRRMARRRRLLATSEGGWGGPAVPTTMLCCRHSASSCCRVCGTACEAWPACACSAARACGCAGTPLTPCQELPPAAAGDVQSSVEASDVVPPQAPCTGVCCHAAFPWARPQALHDVSAT